MYRSEKKRRDGDGDGDRLGGLPEHLILATLCLLPLKSAIATCVLSRRWRYLCMDLPDINISIDEDFCNHKHRDKFFSIVNDVLSKLTSPFINRISFNLGNFTDTDLFRIKSRNYSNVNSWFDWAEKQTRLHEFSFELHGHESGFPPFDVFPDPPLSLFRIPSLVVLELRPWFFVHQDYRLFTDALLHLPNLKRVSVQLLPWIPKVLEKLVSSSPSLEDLSFRATGDLNPVYNYKNTSYSDSEDADTARLFLSSRTLKRLDMNLNQTMNVVLNTPKLEYLSFRVLHSNQPLFYQVSFVNHPPALLGCSIFSLLHSVNNIFMPCNLFTHVSNVISLTINDNKPGPLIAPLKFTRLTHLTLRLCLMSEVTLFSGLPLLKQCPRLEVLTLDLTCCYNLSERTWSLPESNPQCLITSVKTIQIIARPFNYHLETCLLPLLSYLLGTAYALELLRICLVAPRPAMYSFNKAIEQRLINKVFQVPRSSPLCPIEFNGIYQRLLARGIDKATSMGSRIH